MSAEEKAKELANKFYYIHLRINNSIAKQCALIAVDEVLIEVIDAWAKLGLGEIGKLEDYIPYHFWQQVKKEINNL